MSAGKYNITIEQGSTFALPITVQDNSGSVVDLSLYTAQGQVRLNYDSPRPLCNFEISGSLGSGSLGVDGKFVAILSAYVTSRLPAAKGVWDLELHAGTVVHRLLEGIATIVPEVTR